jgi:hypothetical protein
MFKAGVMFFRFLFETTTTAMIIALATMDAKIRKPMSPPTFGPAKAPDVAAKYAV